MLNQPPKLELEPKGLNISIDITKLKMLRREQILRYPRLDTILMVERFIRAHDGEFKKKALWQHLPKKMMYQTFYVVIDYLLESNKISIDSEGKIGWIYYPEEVRKLLKKKHLFWKGNEKAI